MKRQILFCLSIIISISSFAQIPQKINTWYEYQRGTFTRTLGIPKDTFPEAKPGDLASIKGTFFQKDSSGNWKVTSASDSTTKSKMDSLIRNSANIDFSNIRPNYVAAVIDSANKTLGFVPQTGGFSPTGSGSQYIKGNGTYASFPTDLNVFNNGPGFLNKDSLPHYKWYADPNLFDVWTGTFGDTLHAHIVDTATDGMLAHSDYKRFDQKAEKIDQQLDLQSRQFAAANKSPLASLSSDRSTYAYKEPFKSVVAVAPYADDPSSNNQRIPAQVRINDSTMLLLWDQRDTLGVSDGQGIRIMQRNVTWHQYNRTFTNGSASVFETPAGYATGFGYSGAVHLFKVPSGTHVGRILALFTVNVDAAQTNANFKATIFLRYSDDNGASWSSRTSVLAYNSGTSTGYQTGSNGDMVQITSGPHAGRIVCPVYTAPVTAVYQQGDVYSDDNGDTWNVSAFVTPPYQGSENSISLQNNGQDLVMFTRIDGAPTNQGNWKYLSNSTDGGATWGSYTANKSLHTSNVNSSTVQYKGRILFVGPSTTGINSRAHGVVRVSYDNGATWPVRYDLVTPGQNFGYCNIRQLNDSILTVAYESGTNRDVGFNVDESVRMIALNMAELLKKNKGYTADELLADYKARVLADTGVIINEAQTLKDIQFFIDHDLVDNVVSSASGAHGLKITGGEVTKVYSLFNSNDLVLAGSGTYGWTIDSTNGVYALKAPLTSGKYFTTSNLTLSRKGKWAYGLSAYKSAANGVFTEAGTGSSNGTNSALQAHLYNPTDAAGDGAINIDATNFNNSSFSGEAAAPYVDRCGFVAYLNIEGGSITSFVNGSTNTGGARQTLSPTAGKLQDLRTATVPVYLGANISSGTISSSANALFYNQYVIDDLDYDQAQALSYYQYGVSTDLSLARKTYTDSADVAIKQMISGTPRQIMTYGTNGYPTGDATLVHDTHSLTITKDTTNIGLGAVYEKTIATTGAASMGTPSYANPGGIGDRRSLITVTSSLTNAPKPDGTPWNFLVDGDTTSNLNWLTSQGISNENIEFDFGPGAQKYITEAIYKQSTNDTQGTWKWQRSNDNITWTDIGGSFTLGGSTVTTMTTLSTNTTAARYYRIFGVSGTWTSAPFSYEFEFNIADPVYSSPEVIHQIRVSGAAGGTIAIQPDGGNVGIGVLLPSANLQLRAGTAAAGTAPLKLTSGTNLTTPENGAIEYDGSHLFITISGTRYQLDQQTGTSYTFGNGLTNSSGTVGLGGNLSGSTAINGANTSGFTIGSSGSKVAFLDVNSANEILLKGQMQYSYSIATDANYTVSATDHFIELPPITAARTITLPGSPATGTEIKFLNRNGSAFNWSFTGGTVKDLSDATFTNLANNFMTGIVFNGTNWVREY